MSAASKSRPAEASRILHRLVSLASPRGGAPFVVGVDLRVWSIRLVLLERLRGGGFRLLRHREQAVDPLWELDSPAFVRELHEGLKLVIGQSGPVEIWVGPVSDRVRIHQLELPPMSGTQLAQGVYWALQREEAFSPSESVMDFEVGEASSSGGDRKLLPVTGYVMPRPDCETLARLFRQAGYPLHGISLAHHAVLNLLDSGSEEDREGAFAHVHVGAESTRVTILDGGRTLLSRLIPVGVEQLADSLVESVAPTPQRSVALRWLRLLGSGTWDREGEGHPEEKVREALVPALDRLVRQVDRTLEYYRIQVSGGKAVARVFLDGSIAECPACVMHFSGQLAVPVERQDPFEAAESVPTGEVPPGDRAAYVSAFGLALNPSNRAPNFLCTHEQRARQVVIHRLNLAIFAAFAMLAVVLLSYYAVQRRLLGELDAELAAVEARVAASRPLVEASGLMARTARLQQDQFELLRGLDRRRPAAVIAEIGAVTPERIRLDSVSSQLVSKPPALEPWLRVTGSVSTDEPMLDTELSLYVRALEASPLFEAVEIKGKTPVRRSGIAELDFTLEMKITLPLGEVR